jgi:hypothetical protein
MIIQQSTTQPSNEELISQLWLSNFVSVLFRPNNSGLRAMTLSVGDTERDDFTGRCNGMNLRTTTSPVLLVGVMERADLSLFGVTLK